MKADIHPEYVETAVTCTCGSTFTTRSTAKNGVIHADVCSQCQSVLHWKAEDSRYGWSRSEVRNPLREGSRLRIELALLPGAGPGSAACLPRRAVDPRPAPDFLWTARQPPQAGGRRRV